MHRVIFILIIGFSMSWLMSLFQNDSRQELIDLTRQNNELLRQTLEQKNENDK